MHKFNRFYLLSSLVASLLIPTLSFENKIELLPKVENIIITKSEAQFNAENIVTEKKGGNISFSIVIGAFYTLISVLLIFRVLILNWLLIRKTFKGNVIYFKKVKFILHDEPKPPHSYLNYIFISKADFSKGVEEEIINHELAHIKQKHTIDILFIELLIALFWCNPALYFYRNALKLNHEFLADWDAIKGGKDLARYIELIFSQVNHTNSLITNNALSSSFNYFITKKRLMMLTKKNTKKKMVLKQLSIIPVALLGILLFSKNSFAQEIVEKLEDKNSEQQQATINNQNLQNSFDEIINRYLKYSDNGDVVMDLTIKKDEQELLKSIYLKMPAMQQEMQVVKFEKRTYEKNTPTKVAFENWKDSKTYGIWIDNKKISNDRLNNYSNTDFSWYFISKLAKNAVNYGEHVFQINLMTNEFFKQYNDKEELIMMPNNNGE